jgi:hypothetical protein
VPAEAPIEITKGQSGPGLRGASIAACSSERHESVDLARRSWQITGGISRLPSRRNFDALDFLEGKFLAVLLLRRMVDISRFG